MAPKYTLHLINEYKDMDFCFFSHQPAAETLAKEVWYSVTVPLGAVADIHTDNRVFAWCGSIGEDGNTEEGMTVPVTVGTANAPGSTWKTESVNGNALKFISAPPSAGPGAFQIETGSDFKAADNFRIGVAWVDPKDSKSHVPVDTFVAAESSKYYIRTQPKFYVAKVTDNITDVAVGLWDFTNNGMNYGEITVKADGTFSPAVYKKIHS